MLLPSPALAAWMLLPSPALAAWMLLPSPALPVYALLHGSCVERYASLLIRLLLPRRHRRRRHLATRWNRLHRLPLPPPPPRLLPRCCR